MIFLLNLALLVHGHHPLPQAIQPAACAASEAQLRATLASAPRPQRQRALALLWRCQANLPLQQLRDDPDPELRLSAWRLTLKRLPTDDPLWRTATRSLPAKHAQSILRLQRRRIDLERTEP